MAPSKRRSRIHAVQKKYLVRLVQNHFVRTVGRYSGVDFEMINGETWDRFAMVLNRMGPPKVGNEWKSSFYFMQNRVRKQAVKIHQCNANPKDKLSDVDFAIYQMSLPSVLPSNANLGDIIHVLKVEQFGSNAVNTFDINSLDDMSIPESQHEVPENCSANVKLDHQEDISNDQYAVEILEAESHDRHQVDGGCDIEGVPSAQASVELEDEFAVEIFEPELHDIQVNGGSDGEGVPPAQASVELEDEFAVEIFDFELHDIQLNGGSDSEGVPTAQSSVDSEVIENDSMADHSYAAATPSKPASKTGGRITEIQKERLVQLLHNDYLKAVGRFAGANGVGIKAKLWQNIAAELNALGSARTVEQWKTTFNTIKASAKAKLADAHNSNRGPNLTRLEEKIVAMCGMEALDGNQNIGEPGFRYEKSVPSYAAESNYHNVRSSQSESDTELNDNRAVSPPNEAVVLEEILEEIRNESVETSNEMAATAEASAATSENQTSNRLRADRADPIVPSRVSRGHTMNPPNVLDLDSPDIGQQKSNSNVHGSLNRGNTRGSASIRGRGVRGVPRLRVRGSRSFARGSNRSAGRDEMEEITNINQFFRDEDDENDEPQQNRSNDGVQSLVRQTRDRSNLRNVSQRILQFTTS